jgi:hypothetical protein
MKRWLLISFLVLEMSLGIVGCIIHCFMHNVEAYVKVVM